MVQIKPLADSNAVCLADGENIRADAICWQGIHVGAVRNDSEGGAHMFRDLPVGHSAHWSYEVDVQSRQLNGPAGVDWLSGPLFESLLDPSNEHVPVKREILRSEKNVIILNCLDMMYGHCLLKLLNASRHLEDNPERGLIVLIPSFLRWLVPDGAAEIWSVPLGLRGMKDFYPSIDLQIQEFCKDYDSIWLSEAFSHPSRFRIEDYTRIHPHDFTKEQDLVTFIWREDRLWIPHYLAKKLRKVGLQASALVWQKRKVVKLFLEIRRHFPKVRFAVAGLGTSGRFPEWIEDYRTDCFDKTSEEKSARIYAESRIVIGVHGSNMLLPSALAGMTLDLVPNEKWNNHPQDTLPRSHDARAGAFFYRFIPSSCALDSTVSVVISMLSNYRRLPSYFCEDTDINTPLLND
jgi:hypothetical protein